MVPLLLVTTLPLLAGLALPAPTAPTVPGVQPLRTTVERNTFRSDFEALQREYDAAVEKWKQAVKNAGDRDTKRQLRKQDPATSFYPRFEALAHEGDGRSRLWMVEHLRSSGLDRKARQEVLRSSLDELYAKHLDAPWFDPVFDVTKSVRKSIGDVQLEAWLGRAGEKALEPGRRARALLLLGSLMQASEDAERRSRGLALVERVGEDYPNTAAGRQAEETLYKLKHLALGALAPVFEGRTVDGEPLRLEAHRGRVVVLEFFGFW